MPLRLSSSFIFSLVFTSVSVHALSMDVLRGDSQADQRLRGAALFWGDWRVSFYRLLFVPG